MSYLFYIINKFGLSFIHIINCIVQNINFYFNIDVQVNIIINIIIVLLILKTYELAVTTDYDHYDCNLVYSFIV